MVMVTPKISRTDPARKKPLKSRLKTLQEKSRQQNDRSMRRIVFID